MSCNYADGLSPYENKGKCGLPEVFDTEEDMCAKVQQLAEWIKSSKHVVVHTGAGISTSAGIPDFRGPKGVWTLESRGEKPNTNISFDDAKPTVTHMALVSLHRRGYVHYVVTQNVDGLHLKSGFPRQCLSELHGNMFVEQCALCERQFVRGRSVPSVGQKCLDKPCPGRKPGGRACRGKLHDTILDWEAELPYKDLECADQHSRKADLSLCLGSTMQINPSGNLPLVTKKNKGKFVICNLQPTKHDKYADLVIHSFVDEAIGLLCKLLDVTISEYKAEEDPTHVAAKQEANDECSSIDWSLKVSRVSPPRDGQKSSVRLKRRYDTSVDAPRSPDSIALETERVGYKSTKCEAKPTNVEVNGPSSCDRDRLLYDAKGENATINIK